MDPYNASARSGGAFGATGAAMNEMLRPQSAPSATGVQQRDSYRAVASGQAAAERKQKRSDLQSALPSPSASGSASRSPSSSEGEPNAQRRRVEGADIAPSPASSSSSGSASGRGTPRGQAESSAASEPRAPAVQAALDRAAATPPMTPSQAVMLAFLKPNFPDDEKAREIVLQRFSEPDVRIETPAHLACLIEPDGRGMFDFLDGTPLKLRAGPNGLWGFIATDYHSLRAAAVRARREYEAATNPPPTLSPTLQAASAPQFVAVSAPVATAAPTLTAASPPSAFMSSSEHRDNVVQRGKNAVWRPALSFANPEEADEAPGLASCQTVSKACTMDSIEHVSFGRLRTVGEERTKKSGKEVAIIDPAESADPVSTMRKFVVLLSVSLAACLPMEAVLMTIVNICSAFDASFTSAVSTDAKKAAVVEVAKLITTLLWESAKKVGATELRDLTDAQLRVLWFLQEIAKQERWESAVQRGVTRAVQNPRPTGAPPQPRNNRAPQPQQRPNPAPAAAPGSADPAAPRAPGQRTREEIRNDVNHICKFSFGGCRDLQDGTCKNKHRDLQLKMHKSGEKPTTAQLDPAGTIAPKAPAGAPSN